MAHYCLGALLSRHRRVAAQASPGIPINLFSQSVHNKYSVESEEPDVPNAPVALWIADPLDVVHRNGGEWIWDSRSRRKLGVLERRSLTAIMKVAGHYLGQGRTVREI